MQWKRNTYFLLWLIAFGFGVFFSNTWQGFALPGAHPSVTARMPFPATNRREGTAKPMGRALLGVWSGLQTVMTQAIGMYGSSMYFLQAGATFLSVLPQNDFLRHEEAAVASSCYKHFERPHLFTHMKLHFPNLSDSGYSFLGGKHIDFEISTDATSFKFQ